MGNVIYVFHSNLLYTHQFYCIIHLLCTDVVLTGLTAELADAKISEGSENRFVLTTTASSAETSRGVAGDGLWALDAWVTIDPNSEFRYAEQSQILSASQSGQILQPGSSIEYGQVAYDHDLTGITCEQAKYLCVQLRKGDAPTADFNLVAQPDESALKVCNPLKCAGKSAMLVSISRFQKNIGPKFF